MAAKSRRPRSCEDHGASGEVLPGGFDTPRDSPQAGKKQEHPHRAGFARDIVFAEFGYRAGRALDYDDFTDRQPNPAAVWWRP